LAGYPHTCVLRVWTALFLVLCLSGPAYAVDSVHVAIGDGEEHLPGNTPGRMAQIALRWDWDKRWQATETWWADGFWEGELSHFEDGTQNLQAAGLAAVLRLGSAGKRPVHPYMEAGFGLQLITSTHFGPTELSTDFQFGSHLGFGLRLGTEARHELGYRLWHLSNAGLKNPNPGLNFHVLYFGIRF